jgi:hypothetical protein
MLNLAAGTKTVAGADTYLVNRSLRIRLSASAYLNRTFSTTRTDNKKVTISFWMKLGSSIGSATNQTIITGYDGTSAGASGIGIQNDKLTWGFGNNSAGNDAALTATQVFRDPSAWYHIVCVGDSTQATAGNRMSMYVNGVQVTSFTTNNAPNLNLATQIGFTGANNRIGCRWNLGSEFFDGYLAEFYVIDGQALTPTSFGAFNADTGVWRAKAYTGTYGNNGYYLNFADNSALTTSSNAGLGKDNSGNSQFWTTNNISITAGSTYDSMKDVPTLTSATVTNYAVLNPLSSIGNTITNGNLSALASTTTNRVVKSSIAVSSGKWYWETKASVVSASGQFVGVASVDSIFSGGVVSVGYEVGYYSVNGNKYVNGTGSAYGASWTAADTIGVALDVDGGTVTFYKNNTSQGSISITAGQTWVADWNGNQATDSVNFTFGQQPFAYTPPTGFLSVNTYNLPTPTLLQGNKYMDATLYTGNLTGQSITNAGSFKPDLVWIKSRSAATDNKLTDSVRGATKAIISNSTAAETTDLTGMTAFNANGFTVGASTVYNNTSATYAAWQWQAGQGSSSSNTNGSITSTVSVNASAGFSIVTYTGTGANATVGHGLGVAPKMIIWKARSLTNNSAVYHASLGNTGVLNINTTAAFGTSSTYLNNTSPTLTVFSIGTDNSFNSSAATYVAYCFAEIAGFSKFGSYTGNGSTDGTFVYTGFRPKFILIKATGSTQDWYIEDTSRDIYNAAGLDLRPNTSGAETNDTPVMDILSNGFKMRNSSYTGFNSNGATYIYMAFAENPFKYSNAR